METTEDKVSQTPSEVKRSSLLRLPEPSALPRWWAPALLILALAWSALLQTRGSSMPGIAVAIVEAGYLWLVLAYYRWKSVDWFGWTLALCAFAAAAWFGIWRSDDIGTYLTLVLG